MNSHAQCLWTGVTALLSGDPVISPKLALMNPTDPASLAIYWSSSESETLYPLNAVFPCCVVWVDLSTIEFAQGEIYQGCDVRFTVTYHDSAEDWNPLIPLRNRTNSPLCLLGQVINNEFGSVSQIVQTDEYPPSKTYVQTKPMVACGDCFEAYVQVSDS